MIHFTKNKLIFNGILIFSIIALSLAYFIQYILGHNPCNLCLVERIPYFAAIILISLFFVINRYEKLITIFILLFFIFGTVVSFYHVGIEQSIFNESMFCDLSNNVALTKEDLLRQLENKPVSCKDVTFTIMGLSLATINTLISIVVSVILVKYLEKK